MADSEPTNTSTTPQMGQAEMSALADRLRNRADSVVMRDQPEQQRDLRAAASLVMTTASLIRRLTHLQGELRRAADETQDETTERHLRELLGGG
jgi:hypothetical protein